MVQLTRYERSKEDRQELLWEQGYDNDETWQLGSQQRWWWYEEMKLPILLPLFPFYCFCFPLSYSHSWLIFSCVTFLWSWVASLSSTNEIQSKIMIHIVV